MARKQRKSKSRPKSRVVSGRPGSRSPRSVTRLPDGQTMYSSGPAADAASVPDPPLGCIAAPLLVDGEPPVMFVPTLALLQLASLAKREGLPIQVADDVIEKIDSQGQHQLTDLTRVTGEGVTDFVRCRLRLLMQGRDSLHPYEVFADFPSRYVGMLLNSAERMERTHDAVEGKPEQVHRGPWVVPTVKPTWAGSFSFDRVWEDAARALREESDAELVDGMWNVPPDIMVRAETVLHLTEAHLVRVEPEQVQVLPEWDDLHDLMDYARECALPFPTMYLDFEGPGGLAPMHQVSINLYDKGQVLAATDPLLVHLKGALVRAEHASDPGDNTVEQLLVIPYGEVQQGERVAGGYQALGAFMFNAYPTNAISETEMVTYPRDGRLPIRTVVPSVAADVLLRGSMGEIIEPPFNPGLITLPFGARELGENLGIEGMELNKQILAWASVVLSCASRVMAALSIMETEAVVIEDAPLENRDRKRAEKRGWEIAKMVYVRPTRKGSRRETTGAEAHYSHRFWVSGHYKHFPLGTRMADVRPDLVKPCTRHGAASCGTCRRIWTPPFIKGPEDRPLVMKSLVKRRHPELEEVG